MALMDYFSWSSKQKQEQPAQPPPQELVGRRFVIRLEGGVHYQLVMLALQEHMFVADLTDNEIGNLRYALARIKTPRERNPPR